jgi:hypothetical protein
LKAKYLEKDSKWAYIKEEKDETAWSLHLKKIKCTPDFH